MSPAISPLLLLTIVSVLCERVVELLKQAAPIPNWAKILISMLTGMIICTVWKVSLGALLIGVYPSLPDYLLTGALTGALGGVVHEVLKLFEGWSGK